MKYRGGSAVENQPAALSGGFIPRRFALSVALASGAFGPVVALPLASAFQRHASDDSILAADAHAAAAPPSTAETVRQSGPMPSLAPLVKQLRPVVVNINSRFKPRSPRYSQRLPPGHPRVQPGPEEEDNSDPGEGDQQDPMERFFRFFGQAEPDQEERHGLGSGFLIGDGLVLTNNHVVEVQDEQRPGKFRPMDEIKVITDETATGGAREFSAKVIGNDPKTDIALLKVEGKEVGSLKYATLGDSRAADVGARAVATSGPFGPHPPLIPRHTTS